VDLRQINLGSHNLQHLEEEFSEEELKAVFQELAPDKAPGPDGYIGAFYKASWNVIRGIFWQLQTFLLTGLISISTC
jgi:hypothetical protein